MTDKRKGKDIGEIPVAASKRSMQASNPKAEKATRLDIAQSAMFETPLYILSGKQPLRCDDEKEWERWMADENHCRLARTQVDDAIVSTMFLGCDDTDLLGDRAEEDLLLFETIAHRDAHFAAFREAQQLLRYHTWDEAQAGHERVVQILKEEVSRAGNLTAGWLTVLGTRLSEPAVSSHPSYQEQHPAPAIRGHGDSSNIVIKYWDQAYTLRPLLLEQLEPSDRRYGEQIGLRFPEGAMMAPVIQAAVERLGFDNFTFGCIRPVPGQPPELAIYTPVPWKDLTEAHLDGLLQKDPRVYYCYTRLIPALQRWPALSGNEAVVVDAASIYPKFGIRSSVFFPINGPRGWKSMLSLNSRDPEIMDHLPVRLGELFGCGHCWAAYIVDQLARSALLQLGDEMSPALGITAREEEIIILAAKGQRDTDIARLLGIHRRTLEDHWRRISYKLGATTRAETIAVACEVDLIKSGGLVAHDRH